MQLTQSNYYSPEANASYYSVSQIKQFLDCPDCAMAELRGDWIRPKTTALLVGGFVDAHFSCELDQFCKANPEIFTKKGDLKADFVKALDIIQRIESDKLAEMMLEVKYASFDAKSSGCNLVAGQQLFNDTKHSKK